MASELASRLKADWMELSDEYFEPLTFGELKIGEKFIIFPLPGDNIGHGGLRGGSWLFLKTAKETSRSPGISHGGAINMSRGMSCDLPHGMLVLRVLL
ncbi:MAG: hypothetical protein Q7R79_04880 [bacterium]|nr:hypothetical protein [bacterium]